MKHTVDIERKAEDAFSIINLDLSSYAAGMYLVEVKTKSGIQVLKIITK